MSAGTRRVGDTTLAVPVDNDLQATQLGLGVAITKIPRAFKQEIAEYHLDRAYTDTAGQRWFLVRVVWRDRR